MSILVQQVVMTKDREERRRHRKKCRDRNIPPVADGDDPEQVRVVHNKSGRRLKTIEKVVKGSFQFGGDGAEKSHHVVGSNPFGRDDVGYRNESDVVGSRVGSDELEPFFGEDESEEQVRVFG